MITPFKDGRMELSMKKANVLDQAALKLVNLTEIFHMIYDLFPISRADLAKKSGMSPTSITRFVNGLLELNLITEAPAEVKKVGRTATLLKINDSAFYSVGIDIDSSYINVSILNFLKQNIINKRIRTDISSKFEDLLDRAYELYLQALKESKLLESNIKGIGLSVPCIITGPELIKLDLQIQFGESNLYDLLAEKFHMDNIVIENDCNAALTGQCVLHPEYNEQSVSCLAVGSGIGSAFSYRGSIITSPERSVFSEIGHTVIDPKGMLCACGNRGCLETYISKGNLIRRAQEHDPSIILFEEIHSAWVKEMKWARDLINDACTYSKIAINNLACVYNPDVVLVCGSNIDDYWDMFHEICEGPQLLFAPFRNKLKIIPFFDMSQSSIIGVSKVVQDRFVKQLLKQCVSNNL